MERSEGESLPFFPFFTILSPSANPRFPFRLFLGFSHRAFFLHHLFVQRTFFHHLHHRFLHPLAEDVQGCDAGGREADPRDRQPRGDRARLRHGRVAGAAPRARSWPTSSRARAPTSGLRSTRGGPHAGPHECAARRGRRPGTTSSSRWTTSIRTCRSATCASSSGPTTS